jgi:hypothetical protein
MPAEPRKPTKKHHDQTRIQAQRLVPFPLKARNIVIVLGDQLDAESSALQDFEAAHDAAL